MILVHDYLLVRRGAERVFLAMCAAFPTAPIATLLYDGRVFDGTLGGRAISTSFYQKLGVSQRTFRALLPVLPAAAGRLPVTGHKVVLSSSSAFAHGVKVDRGAVHVCYCHTPFRYAWFERRRALAEVPVALRPVVALTLRGIRRWDRRVASRPTHYVANSRLSQARIARYWGRRAPVIHPPVEVERFQPGKPEDYFLVVGELLQHKRVDVALEAALLAGAPIKVVGHGPEEARLRERYGRCAEFLGRIDDRELAALYSGCRALVMPGVEEFGITSIEAQASGRPVIAADAGGARETVVPGVTGVLVKPGDVMATARAMRGRTDEFDPVAATENAQRFSAEAFQTRLVEEIDAAEAQ